MESKPVKEKKPFNCEDDNMPFYIECLHRNIVKKAPPSIYHYHSDVELLYCVEGELAVTLFSETLILKSGDYLYLSPNTPHATTAHTDSNEHICVKFVSSIIHINSSRKIPPEDYYISLAGDYNLFRESEDNKDYIRDLFFKCVENYSHDDYFKRLTLTAVIMQLMSHVLSNSISQSAIESTKEISETFLSVLDYVDKNYATVTLEDAANYCSLSYSYFSRNFKTLFNISFSNYVIKKRIEKSLNLITSTNMSLNDIALECGFANLSHFIKCFNEEKGMTPKKFRSIVSRN
ncbi:MAG: AraC family transcriptional regulator [Clostridia bacterium]|nr:AraC family transcriptional regulator [Clostridia bacterium]